MLAVTFGGGAPVVATEDAAVADDPAGADVVDPPLPPPPQAATVSISTPPNVARHRAMSASLRELEIPFQHEPTGLG
jgi:hypothetical protein